MTDGDLSPEEQAAVDTLDKAIGENRRQRTTTVTLGNGVTADVRTRLDGRLEQLAPMIHANQDTPDEVVDEIIEANARLFTESPYDREDYWRSLLEDVSPVVLAVIYFRAVTPAAREHSLGGVLTHG